MEFNLVALGGTFDIVHIGHIALLEKGFSISKKVIIGLTSDQFAKRKGKTLVHDFQKRVSILESVIRDKFPYTEYDIAKLEN